VGSAARRRSPKRALPEDWTPTGTHQSFAREHGLDLALESTKFRTHAVANDRRLASWDAGFTQWLIKSREFQAKVEATQRPSQWDRAQRVGGGW
jgi:hypothetical protein